MLGGSARNGTVPTRIVRGATAISPVTQMEGSCYVREFRESDEPECKTCGACCVGTEGDFVPVTALDKRRLPTKYLKKLQLTESNTVGSDSAVRLCASSPDVPYGFGLKRFGIHQACVALKGTLGKDISCDIYAQRPEFCRTFERGGDDCRARRAELFVITPVAGE